MRGLDKLRYYGKYTLESVVLAGLSPFTIPSNRRKRRERGEVKQNFLEDIISSAAALGVIPIEIMFVLSYRPLGAAFLLSNMCSLGNELRRFSLREASKYLQSLPHNVVNGVKKIPDGFRRRLWKLPRATAVLACSYAILLGIAYSHYKIPPKLERYYPNRVDLTVREFDFETNNRRYRLYFLGEAHIYNYSSFIYAQNLVRNVRPDRLLTEGMYASERKVMHGWRKDAEFVMFLSRKILAAGANRRYPDLALVCFKEGVPITPLEVADPNTGGREGLSDTTYAIIGGVSALSLVAAPQLYFAGVGLRYGAFPKLEKVAHIILPGAVYKRNEIMVESAVEKIDRFGDSGVPIYFLRMGQAHVDGMVSEFRKYGNLREVKTSRLLPSSKSL